MPELIYDSPQMTKAIDLCWQYQRILTISRLERWPEARRREHVESWKQQMRRFSRGIRTEAHLKFLGEINDELGKPPGQRNPLKPVGINEAMGWSYNPGDTGPSAPGA